MKPETKYKGAIKLSAIGDALGWITEFEKSASSLEKKYGNDVIDRFYDWSKNVGGKFYGYTDHIAAGSYSDDTQLMLSVARSIQKDGCVDNAYFSKRELSNWLYYARGGGRTVKHAAEKTSRKSVSWFNNFYSYKVDGKTVDYRDTGANGAAMRVMPIALANLGNIEKILAETFKNSIVTHGHPRAIIGAMLFNYAINQIIVYRPEGFSWESYLASIGKDLTSKLDYKNFISNEINIWLNEWDKGSLNKFEQVYLDTLIETQNLLRVCYQLLKIDADIQEALTKFGCFAPETKGSGISTVVAGIFLALKFNYKPLDAIRSAVNALGTDTDSIAAFTGALIGALHGQHIIPDKWKGVQDVDYLEKIALDLLAISEDKQVLEGVSINGDISFVEYKTWDFHTQDTISFDPLGEGVITNIEKQDTLTSGKFNLIIDVIFNIGQSCRFSKVFSKDVSEEPNKVVVAPAPELEVFREALGITDFQILEEKLKSKSFKRQEVLDLLKWFLRVQKED